MIQHQKVSVDFLPINVSETNSTSLKMSSASRHLLNSIDYPVLAMLPQVKTVSSPTSSFLLRRLYLLCRSTGNKFSQFALKQIKGTRDHHCLVLKLKGERFPSFDELQQKRQFLSKVCVYEGQSVLKRLHSQFHQRFFEAFRMEM